MAIEKYDVYEEYVTKLLKVLHILYTEQLTIILRNKFKVSQEQAEGILAALQRNGKLLMSEDGWTLTYEYYKTIIGDRFLEDIHKWSAYRVSEIKNTRSKVDYNLIDSLWVFAGMAGEIDDFILPDAPWDLMFYTKPTDKENSIAYQIVRINNANKEAMHMALDSIPKIYDEDIQKCLRRIAIVDDEEHKKYVPNVGFSIIFKMDHDDVHHIKVVEKRTSSDRWEQ